MLVLSWNTASLNTGGKSWETRLRWALSHKAAVVGLQETRWDAAMVLQVTRWLALHFPEVILVAAPVTRLDNGHLPYGGSALLFNPRADKKTRKSHWRLIHDAVIIPGSTVVAVLQNSDDGGKFTFVSTYLKCGGHLDEVRCRSDQLGIVSNALREMAHSCL